MKIENSNINIVEYYIYWFDNKKGKIFKMIGVNCCKHFTGHLIFVFVFDFETLKHAILMLRMLNWSRFRDQIF